MKPTINTPYVKKYDKNGNVVNPIIGTFLTEGDNRKVRRAKLPTRRFVGNGKNFPITVVGKYKYMRSIQHEYDEDGNSKKIYHYLPC